MTVQGVTIGDQFIDTCHRKSKIVSTVVDFAETRSMTTGKLLHTEVVAQHQFCGQTVTSKTLLITAQIHKIANQ